MQPGQFDMYLGYGDRDQFYMDSEVDSFAYRARQRGLLAKVDCLSGGKHDLLAGLKLLPHAIAWMAPLLAPYSPSYHRPAISQMATEPK